MDEVSVRKAHITDQLCSADHIKPIDFLRPVIGGSIYGLIAGTLVSLPFLCHINLALALGLGAYGVIFVPMIMGPMFMLAALIHFSVWRSRLKKEGVQAFQRFVAVDMPLESAFELALAATAAIKNSKIESFDEAGGHIVLRVKGNFWITVDRKIEIILERIDASRTRIRVGSLVNLSKFRDKGFRLIWGSKFYPIIMTNDLNLNRKLMIKLVSEIEAIPNWDYQHVPHKANTELDELADSKELPASFNAAA